MIAEVEAYLALRRAAGYSMRDADCIRETIDFLTAGSRAGAGSSTV